MDTTSKWFEYLHKERGLSEEIIRDAGLTVEKNRLRIPVFDEDGNEVFSKYRRAPWKEDGPKYTYETGSSASLYGTHFPIIGSDNYVVEGEMDVLAMRTIGYDAYTGTGGALTFRESWLDKIPNRPVVILFDNDDTGIKGAIKLAKLLGSGTYKWVPPMYGKDVSDLLKATGADNARRIIESQEGVSFDLTAGNQSEQKELVKKLSEKAQGMEHCVGKQFLLQLIFDIKLDTREKKPKKHHKNFDNAVDNAKSYPMENIIKFTARKACCPFHSERTPSFHLYPDNHAFCHGGCNRAYDTIDVYRKLYGGTFLEAVEALNKMI
jgi:DNA primase